MCIPLWFDVGKWLLSSDDGLHFSPTALVNGIKADFFGTMDEFKRYAKAEAIGVAPRAFDETYFQTHSASFGTTD
ncbi:hypothetical protein SARC_01494 [Sphaeroforma arctica JP610]|uniref:Uncharacterized protein n=1 Tax=Sphaeroforma arctica JP610 TaxID=667725 RepID=A0A0L0GBG4_9EUKA|nr:hypothetical protein SARC_01494 [Sphaeroforma arctica JP610]KNC86362.1 hypothetical protein SARC_01494 [Sphaeroforma arctica JP610]|eukprot:XP_014160264.1 hypothetical protein SARC_01494 [Sphaeroforma arctica JP610]